MQQFVRRAGEKNSSPIKLSTYAGYSTFGEYLLTKRNQLDLTQQAFVLRINDFLRQEDLPTLSVLMYGGFERKENNGRDRRSVQLFELFPIFRAIVSFHADKFLPSIPEIEAQTYFYLAKKHMMSKKRKRPHLSGEEWNAILQQIVGMAGMIGRSQHTHVQIVSNTDGNENILALEAPNSRRRQALTELLSTDTDSLLEREAWASKLSQYPDRDPQTKVTVIQGGMGAGKTHALALLTQRLAERGDLFLIPYQFEYSDTKTSVDQFNGFLGMLLSDLTMRSTDESKPRPLADRVEQVLRAIRALDCKVAILIDDAQFIFPQTVEWDESWHLFFKKFINESHMATIYVMTRTWPNWDERKLSFIEEEYLPDLSVEASIQLWRNNGYDDVDETLLRQVCLRWGSNPQVIEMLARQYKRGGLVTLKSGVTGSSNVRSLKGLLTSDRLFSGRVSLGTRQILQKVFSNRLTCGAMQLLETLAVSPLGLPLELMIEHVVGADEFLDDLDKVSFLDQSLLFLGRVGIVPLVKEAVLQSLSAEDKAERDRVITNCYAHWLSDYQDFRNDHEKASLITEVVVRRLMNRQFMDAADLFIQFDWLCALFGQIDRIHRIFNEVVNANRGKPETIAQEVGKLLLQYNISLKMAQAIDREWRDHTYQYIYRKVLLNEVNLYANLEIDVLHHLLTMYLNKTLFDDASRVLNETFTRLVKNDQLVPDIHAFFLGTKARLFARWSESENDIDRASSLREQCIVTLEESIAQWRHCLKNAKLLQIQYMSAKLARALHSYAYRQRLSGNLVMAQKAIEESLLLKREHGALSHSMAVSLSEYSQILGLRGEILKALNHNEEACTILQRLVDEGDTIHAAELGGVLAERANLLYQQARLVEAKEMLEKALPLLATKKSRSHSHSVAEKRLETISFILETKQHYQLDKHLFSRYQELAAYDDGAWIAQSGPFNQEEAREWEQLACRPDLLDVSTRRTAIIVESYRREIALSQEEGRAPRISYPCIPLTEVQVRIQKFEQFLVDITNGEEHPIVQSLYCAAIKEQIEMLRRHEATVLGNQDAVWQCNLSLFGKPTIHEMYIALQSLCKMLYQAERHPQAGPIAQSLLIQLHEWGLSPRDIVTMEFFTANHEAVPSYIPISTDGQREFSHEVVQRFFQSVLDGYHADGWKVIIDARRTATSVSALRKELSLPIRTYTLGKIRELLLEEVGVHVLRSRSGALSPVALLGTGLDGYNVTEEGLAKHLIQQKEAGGKIWLGTLATGLASGVLTPALSFYELASFLERRSLVDSLITGDSWNTAVANAKQDAWKRAARTFRGVPDLNASGCCSLKDVVYLRGYLKIQEVLETTELSRLFVGKIDVKHLPAMNELNILVPFCNHHLALAPDLLEQVCRFVK